MLSDIFRFDRFDDNGIISIGSYNDEVMKLIPNSLIEVIKLDIESVRKLDKNISTIIINSDLTDKEFNILNYLIITHNYPYLVFTKSQRDVPQLAIMSYKLETQSGNYFISYSDSRVTTAQKNLQLYSNGELLVHFDAVDWLLLARHSRVIKKYELCYTIIIILLLLTDEPKFIAHAHFELSIILYYMKKVEQGKQSCYKALSLIDNHEYSNLIMLNLSYYCPSLSVKFADTIKIVNISLSTNEYKSSSMSLYIDNGNLIGIQRFVNYSLHSSGSYTIRAEDNKVRTINHLVTLGDNLEITSRKEIESPKGTYDSLIKGLEDIRFIDRNTLIAVSNEYNSKKIPELCYIELKDDKITKLLPLRINGEIKTEKNWLPIIINDGKIQFIYSYHPFIIYSFDPSENQLKKIHEQKTSLYMKNMRGSAAPIPYRNGHLILIHSVHYALPRKYYHQFLYLVNNELHVSEFFVFKKPAIEYCIGMVQYNNNLLLCYSSDDNSTEIMSIPLSAVDSMIDNCPYE